MIYEYKNPNIELVNKLKQNQTLRDDEFLEALISAALYAEDREWIKATVIQIINGNYNYEIIGAALKALGHIARIDRNINLHELNTISDNVLKNAAYNLLIEDLKDDIAIFNL